MVLGVIQSQRSAAPDADGADGEQRDNAGTNGHLGQRGRDCQRLHVRGVLLHDGLTRQLGGLPVGRVKRSLLLDEPEEVCKKCFEPEAQCGPRTNRATGKKKGKKKEEKKGWGNVGGKGKKNGK